MNGISSHLLAEYKLLLELEELATRHPTDLFTISEPPNPSSDNSGLRKVFEALEL